LPEPTWGAKQSSVDEWLGVAGLVPGEPGEQQADKLRFDDDGRERPAVGDAREGGDHRSQPGGEQRGALAWRTAHVSGGFHSVLGFALVNGVAADRSVTVPPRSPKSK
jgi:hypothetical protein